MYVAVFALIPSACRFPGIRAVATATGMVRNLQYICTILLERQRQPRPVWRFHRQDLISGTHGCSGLINLAFNNKEHVFADTIGCLGHRSWVTSYLKSGFLTRGGAAVSIVPSFSFPSRNAVSARRHELVTNFVLRNNDDFVLLNITLFSFYLHKNTQDSSI